MDRDILTVEVLNVLQRTIPTREDIARLKEYKGDPSELADLEKYYLELMNIPRFEKRIQISSFMWQYCSTLKQAEHDLKLLDCACDQLMCNTSFVKLLEAVLAIGNYLNGGTCRGAAKGFKLDALLKLMDIKDSNKKTTLLHFVVSELLRVNDKILNLSDELKDVKVASSLNLDSVKANVGELEYGMDTIKEEVHLSSEDPGQDPMFKEHFLNLVVPFFEQATLDMQKLKTLSNATFEKIKDVSIYFGETMETKGQIDLFRTMREFLHMFDIVCKDIRESRKEGKNMAALDSKVILRPLNRQSGGKEVSHRTSSKRVILSCGSENKLNLSENVSQTHEDKPNNLEMPCILEDCPNTSPASGSGSNLANKLLTQTQKITLQKSPRIGYDSDWSTGTG